MNTNGSGVAALLELVRVFQKLLEAYGDSAKYDLMFLLTPTGSLGYKGTDSFLADLPESYAQNIVFGLCLDSIGEGSGLSLHVSRYPRENEETGINIFNALNATAKQMGVKLKIVKKAINLTNEYVSWEHERFAHKKIHAVTLSSKENASTNLIDKASVYDKE